MFAKKPGDDVVADLLGGHAQGTVTRMPFHALVPLTMSSPTFLGDMPNGPTFGASTEDGACSPPYCLNVTTFTSLGSNFGAMAACGCRGRSCPAGRWPVCLWRTSEP